MGEAIYTCANCGVNPSVTECPQCGIDLCEECLIDGECPNCKGE